MKGNMGMINDEFITRELLLKKDSLNDFFSKKIIALQMMS